MANGVWKYSPSEGAGIAFAIIYGITTIIHIYQFSRYRALYCIPIIIGALWEAGGYAVRAYANQNLNSVPVYAAQSVLIVLAPACMFQKFAALKSHVRVLI
jgi:hypothetical protein